jgi:site-specific DNA-methyltransferase (adenine-specific)
MNGEADQAYGSLVEGVFIAGFTLERAFQKLEWLLTDARWKTVGGGYEDVNQFLDTIKLDQFKIIAEQRKKIAAVIKKLEPKASNVQIAKVVGVSDETIRRDTTNVEAGKKDTKQTKATPKAETTNVALALTGAAAAATVISKAAKDERKAAKEQAREAAIAENLKVLPAVSDRFRLLCSDLATADIAPGSIDCIVTDPPYPEEFLPVFATLAWKAAMWLKPGGSMLVMSGHMYLPQVLAHLTHAPGLNYHWTLAYLTPGGQAAQMFPRKVNTFWKPVFWLVKGEYSGDWVGDVTRSDVNDNDKRFHHWGQSESGMADLIGRISMPGQTILDPFCGGGTTGVVAVQMDRKFIGIDVSEQAIATTASRLHEVANAAMVA